MQTDSSILSAAKENSHSGRTLREHLDGTANILRHWLCDDDVVNVGLYHSVYGTSVYKTVTTTDRDLVREAIGEYAESLVYKFCITPNPRMQNFINERNTALILVECANLMEQKSRNFRALDQAIGYVPKYIGDDIQFYIMDHH